MVHTRTVQRLTDADRAAVVEILATSFHDYPVMRFVLSDAGQEYDRHLRALIGFFADARFLREWPVLGVRRGAELVAVALVSEPVYVSRPPALKTVYERLHDSIGAAALAQMNRYERGSSVHKPEEPHYFLGMIGVLPDFQAQGYGRALLDHLHDMSRTDPESRGVCLSTEDPGNVPYYERVGYRVVGEADVGDIHSWCMFRPDDA